MVKANEEDQIRFRTDNTGPSYMEDVSFNIQDPQDIVNQVLESSTDLLITPHSSASRASGEIRSMSYDNL